MLIDDVLVASDIEVLDDILENSLSRRTTALLHRRQSLTDHLAVLWMIGQLLGFAAYSGPLFRALGYSRRLGGLSVNDSSCCTSGIRHDSCKPSDSSKTEQITISSIKNAALKTLTVIC